MRSRAEIARDAVDAGAVRTVWCQVDVEHRIVDAEHVGEWLADRRIGRHFDDAVAVVGVLDFGARNQHAEALDIADLADAKRDVLAWDIGAGRAEHGLHAAARVRRAAHDLDRLAFAGIDHADAQPVGVRVLHGG